MKWFVSCLLITFLSLVAELYLPFWSVAIISFAVVALIPQSSWKAFWCGFAGLFLLWAGLAFFLDSGNDQILSSRISLLFLKVQSPALLVLVTGVLGGMLGGMGALSASFLRPAAAGGAPQS
jgi:hypothetical protein